MTDEIVTPENTLLIAKWAGFFGVWIQKKAWVFHQVNGQPVSCDFITNAEQSRESEEKLLDLGWRIHKWFDTYYLTLDKSDAEFTEIEAKTLPLALYKAALYEANK